MLAYNKNSNETLEKQERNLVVVSKITRFETQTQKYYFFLSLWVPPDGCRFLKGSGSERLRTTVSKRFSWLGV